MKINTIFSLFSKELPSYYEIIDNSHGDGDFRNTIIADYNDKKIVIKIACNDFTTIDKVTNWYQIIKLLNQTGYYHPNMIFNINNKICQEILIDNKKCIVYAEEYSKYITADKVIDFIYDENSMYIYHNEAIEYIGKVSALHLNCVNQPGYYDIFNTISNKTNIDEIKETALICKNIIEGIPNLKGCFEKVWDLFCENEEKLKSVYDKLPVSVYQSDMNTSNILLNDNLKFMGVLDFNCSGKIPCIVYMFREFLINFNECVTDEDEKNIFFDKKINENEFNCFINNLKLISKFYVFSKFETSSMILLYKYIRPFWWNTVYILRKYKDHVEKVKLVIDWIYNELSREIDFENILKV